jgi:superfamily I DNA/RNA helicase
MRRTLLIITQPARLEPHGWPVRLGRAPVGQPRRLRVAGQPVEIGPDGPAQPDGVHMGTTHRFKGLEYRRVIIATASNYLVPRAVINRCQDSNPKRYNHERARNRSRLFVAATRDRDDLAVDWQGTRSPFIPDHLAEP